MAKRAAKSLARALATLWLLTLGVFVALRLTGDPARIILGPEARVEDVERFREARGLGGSLPGQYWDYMRNLARLDFGNSYVTGLPVREVFFEALGGTLRLMIPTALATLLIGVPLGVLAALVRGGPADRALMALSVFGYAVPNFVFGTLLMLVFTVRLGWLPAHGDATRLHYVMPVLTIAASEAAIFSRVARGAMIDALGQPSVLAARARGLPPWRVVWLHALPGALVGIMTMAGFFLGTLAGGAVITENVFSWPGTGRLLVIGVASRDIPVVQMVVLGLGASLIAANLLVDLLSPLVNPRLRDAAP